MPENAKENSDPLVEKLSTIIDANLNNEQFGVEQLAKEISISRSHLHRKLHKITGKSISQFIREYKLEKARELLLNTKMNSSEVSAATGFSSLSYFSKCFSEFYGYPPSKVHKYEFINKSEVLEIDVKRKPNVYQKLVLIVLSILVISSLLYFKNKKINTKSRIAKVENDKTVLVLPFKNLSNNKENEYLANGMVDAITRHLSNINNIKVISSSASTSSYYKSEIEKNLDASYLLEGSLQRQDSIIRVEVKLLKTSDKSQVWAESYDRKILDLLYIQNDISEKIVRALRNNMVFKKQMIISKLNYYDTVAYNSYLKGMHSLSQVGNLGMDQSLEYFQQAIAIDSFFAPAYSAIAYYYQMRALVYQDDIDINQSKKKAIIYLDLALKLDKNWHFNFVNKAFQLTFFDWNFEEAEKRYISGIKAEKTLNYIMYRDFLQIENRHDEALKITLEMHKKTPFHLNSSLILPYYYNEKFEEAEKYINERLNYFPDDYLTLINSGFYTLNTGQYSRAIRILKKLMESKNTRFPVAIGLLGATYAKNGEIDSASKLLKELKRLKSLSDAGSPAWFIAIIYSALGQKEQALKWLQISINDHEIEVLKLVSEPQFYPLHGDSRFDALVKQVGFRSHAYPIRLTKQLN